MSDPTQENAVIEEMAVDSAQEVQPGDAPQPKSKKGKAPETLTRDVGKSILPYARVQKILKADKELIMVQREAGFLISRATEEFVCRLAEAAQLVASRERRTTVQAKDLVSSIRRADEFAFLEELLPWLEPEQPTRKPAAAAQVKGKGKGKNKDDGRRPGDGGDAGRTMLDNFVTKPVRDGSPEPDEDEEDGPLMNIVMNEDGTMSMEEAPS